MPAGGRGNKAAYVVGGEFGPWTPGMTCSKRGWGFRSGLVSSGFVQRSRDPFQE